MIITGAVFRLVRFIRAVVLAVAKFVLSDAVPIITSKFRQTASRGGEIGFLGWATAGGGYGNVITGNTRCCMENQSKSKVTNKPRWSPPPPHTANLAPGCCGYWVMTNRSCEYTHDQQTPNNQHAPSPCNIFFIIHSLDISSTYRFFIFILIKYNYNDIPKNFNCHTNLLIIIDYWKMNFII